MFPQRNSAREPAAQAYSPFVRGGETKPLFGDTEKGFIIRYRSHSTCPPARGTYSLVKDGRWSQRRCQHFEEKRLDGDMSERGHHLVSKGFKRQGKLPLRFLDPAFLLLLVWNERSLSIIAERSFVPWNEREKSMIVAFWGTVPFKQGNLMSLVT